MTYPVSVQICTLNEEENIRGCLTGIAANDPEEIVVIDGGSNDRTVKIAQEFGARVLTPGKLGLGPSRRLGYLSSTAKYTAFVDADDRLTNTWLETMVKELEAGDYSALQSSLRAVNEGTWWSKGWNEYFIESVKPIADSKIVGRPALFRTHALQSDPSDLISLDEDTHLSRRFELQGLRQGIGTAIAHRRVEQSWHENKNKWISYGKGYKGFVQEHPDRKSSILLHMFVTIPLTRGFAPLKRGKLTQPAFAALMSASILKGYWEC